MYLITCWFQVYKSIADCSIFQNFIFNWMTLHLKIPMFKPPESSWHNFKDADNWHNMLMTQFQGCTNIFSIQQWNFWHPVGCDKHSATFYKYIVQNLNAWVAINVTYVNSVANALLWTKLRVRSVYIIAVRERKCQLEGALRSRPCSL